MRILALATGLALLVGCGTGTVTGAEAVGDAAAGDTDNGRRGDDEAPGDDDSFSDEDPSDIDEKGDFDGDRDDPAILLPPAQTGFVGAAAKSESPRYRMVFTVGEPSPAQGVLASPRYRLSGGSVAVTR